jgi:hypothetical protein
MTDYLRGRPVLAAMLDDETFLPEDKVVQVGARSGMSLNTAVGTTFRRLYGKRADRVTLDEDTDYPSMLAGNPYHFDKVIPHVRRLFLAYIQAFQRFCDWTDAFVDPHLPWEKPWSAHQKRCYYRSTRWKSHVDWTDQDAEIAKNKYLRAVARLDPGRKDHWECILEDWRQRHNRNLPHEPVRGPHTGIGCWSIPEIKPREVPPAPVYRNARERRQALVAKRKAAKVPKVWDSVAGKLVMETSLCGTEIRIATELGA